MHDSQLLRQRYGSGTSGSRRDLSAHLEAKGVGGAANQERQAVPHDGVGGGVRHARRREHTVQVLCGAQEKWRKLRPQQETRVGGSGGGRDSDTGSSSGRGGDSCSSSSSGSGSGTAAAAATAAAGHEPWIRLQRPPSPVYMQPT